jgi:hypothetical protein
MKSLWKMFIVIVFGLGMLIAGANLGYRTAIDRCDRHGKLVEQSKEKLYSCKLTERPINVL